ncbi:TPA: helix-turn-helix domain-containing protein [Listeria monocytogenes]|nr:helix-turn-helix domain-containing protein [Listeria monocytogenes]EAH3957223.1 helix-turn-helix domain-containing protein [Listeria monocytogenes]EKA2552541.1 transposase [Listeria monocytogenes]EKA2555658.1 transposase [Listeria monocytogenes]EKA2558803.1 transposase [Listeria monocytogenes]
MTRVEYKEVVQKSLVFLYYRGNTIASICKEYGVPRHTFLQWIKLYSGEEIETKEVLTFLQIRELKKQKLKLEEEAAILDEAIKLLEGS